MTLFSSLTLFSQNNTSDAVTPFPTRLSTYVHAIKMTDTIIAFIPALTSISPSLLSFIFATSFSLASSSPSSPPFFCSSCPARRPDYHRLRRPLRSLRVMLLVQFVSIVLASFGRACMIFSSTYDQVNFGGFPCCLLASSHTAPTIARRITHRV